MVLVPKNSKIVIGGTKICINLVEIPFNLNFAILDLDP
jgi:hypothetical protein